MCIPASAIARRDTVISTHLAAGIVIYAREACVLGDGDRAAVLLVIFRGKINIRFSVLHDLILPGTAQRLCGHRGILFNPPNLRGGIIAMSRKINIWFTALRDLILNGTTARR